jgi:hypothetical protein
MRYLFSIVFFIHVSLEAAQITGQIRDFSTGNYITGAEIFINQSMNKVLSDENGFFTLDDIQPGTFTIACFKDGYEIAHTVHTVNESDIYTLFILKKEKRKKIKDAQLQQRIISQLLSSNKLFPEWDKSVALKSATLVQQNNTDAVSVAGKLVFENKVLGYTITSHIVHYTQDKLTAIHQFYPLRGSEEKQNQWDDNRHACYQLSVNNFLEAVLQTTTDLHGYQIYNHLNAPISLNQALQVGFSGESNILHLDHRIKVVQTYHDQRYESWLEADSIVFTDHGLILNPEMVTRGGIFSEQSLAVMLPLEYTPPIEKKYFKLISYFEKSYLHTDKPYYYPGDTLWFKAYLNYANLEFIESLSKVMYVELIDQHGGGRIIDERILKINDGQAWGEFLLPDTLNTEFIAVRAYTHWQLNYGDDQVFIKYFPLVKRSDNLMNQRTEVQTNKQVRILFDKQKYDLRDKIKMGIIVSTEDGQPVSAWMSVSVTDRSMVRLLEDSVTINNTFAIKPFPEPGQVMYAIEKGISINGQFMDHRSKPVMASLTLTSEDFAQAFEFDTDLDGNFTISGLDFSDSATVLYTARNRKFLFEGKVKLSERKTLPLSFTWPTRLVNVERADFKIDKNTTLLNEVTIQTKRIEAQPVSYKQSNRIVRVLGEPNYVFTPDQLNQAAINVIEMIRGRVPGLTITFDGANYGFKFNRTTSIALSTEPAIFIDDVPMAGSAQQALMGLNPGDIASIEVITSLNSIAGSLGVNGIIAVYTKAGGLRGKFQQNDSGFKSFSVRGYSNPLKFSGINHQKTFMPADSDYRTTLLWASDVVSSSKYGPAWLEFFASDSTGPYLVTIEGVTIEGKPFRDERLIQLKDNE